MATLEIGNWSSRCLSCNQGADPGETHHNTILSYSKRDDYTGCGEEYTDVSLNYVYGDMDATVEHLKTDRFPHLANLPWNYFKYPDA